ncbi:dihydrofolate reductase-like domain-containing protein [Multifurca ochricompacta]|uniref:2,5-diamino-6-ribosylamino-4(3H)-pyrimidinone 5'-phosphate reductase n=1 Tax=Multifurca ochricompacta TaxID=376703 RepID=A0AAD4MDX2_9AGAM|nr:dihydrofolate reductase-like domain-containing protein [Multifurca ochricompacta]
MSVLPPALLASVLGTLPADVRPGTAPLTHLVSPDSTRPYVTLTFAQSIDAKIAGAGGKQLILSGEESMKMTHWMRTMHDGILIGIGTAMNDNPQLNVRHLPFPVQNTHFQHYHHPRPLILDPHLRLSPTCKLVINAAKSAGVAPWVISARPPKIDGFFANEDDGERLQQWEARRDVLQAAGVTVILVEPETIHPDLPPVTLNLPLPAVLRTLREKGIRSIMVEGGARVIQSFLSTASGRLVDALIVTTAPVLVGRDGIGYGDGLGQVSGTRYLTTELLGRDTVVGLKFAQ